MGRGVGLDCDGDALCGRMGWSSEGSAVMKEKGSMSPIKLIETRTTMAQRKASWKGRD